MAASALTVRQRVDGIARPLRVKMQAIAARDAFVADLDAEDAGGD